MNLRRLEYFTVLARELHFTRAADEIGITQPALSQQIKTLERELDVDLFERRGREVRLSAAGAALVREAAGLLNRSAAVERTVRAAARGRSGVLRVAYTRSGADLCAGELVRGFRQARPDVQVEAMTGWTSWNLSLLKDERVDAAYLRGPVRERGVEVRELETEDMVVALPEDHPLAARPAVRAADLADEPVVLWPRHQGPEYYDSLVEQVWPERGPRLVLEEPESEHILAAVAHGTCLSVLGTRRAAKLCPPGVTWRRFVEPRPRIALSLAWRRGDPRAVVRDFVAYCTG